MLEGINILAIIVAIISSWVLGGIWYNLLFKSFYCKDNTPPAHKKHPLVTFGIAFVLWAIAATAFNFALGPNPPLYAALSIGALTGACFVSTSLGVNYAFSGRSFVTFLIDSSYHILQFTLYGLIYGLWHS